MNTEFAPAFTGGVDYHEPPAKPKRVVVLGELPVTAR
jgi:hypothetical protein